MSTAEIGPWPAERHGPARPESDTDSFEIVASPWSAHGAGRRGLGRAALGGPSRTGPVALTDAHLARAALHDQGAFAAIYDRYADRLHDFCLGLLRDHHGAADAVQDTFCTAATRLAQLQDPEKLRPWLYAIARNEAMRRLRGRTREQLSDTPPDAAARDPQPEVLAARHELAALVSEAAGGLSDRDRTVLELHYHAGLDGPELADALGVSHSNANTLVARLRVTIDRSLGALLLARQSRRGQGRCAELDTVLARWDGQFTVLWRKRIARHVEGCATCQARRGELVNPRALLGAAPILVPAPGWLRTHVLTQTPTAAAPPSVVSGAAAASGSGAAHLGWWPPAAASAHSLPALPLMLTAPLLVVGSVAAMVFSAGATTTTNPVAATVPAPDRSGSPVPAPTAPNAPHFTFDMPTTNYAPPPGVPPHPAPRPAGPAFPAPGAPLPAPGAPPAPRGGPLIPPPGAVPPVGPTRTRAPEPAPAPAPVVTPPNPASPPGRPNYGDPRNGPPTLPTPAAPPTN